MKGKITVMLLGVVSVCMVARGYCYEVKGITLTPSVSLSETYDDNITYTKDDKEDDFITAVALGLAAKREAPTFVWEAICHITPEFFAEHTDFNKPSEDFSFSAVKELSKREKISLSEYFLHAYEPKTFIQTFGRTLGRYSYYVNKFALEYAKELSRQWTFKAAYGHELYSYSTSGSGNSYLNSFTIEGDYALSSYTTLLLLYSFSARTFDPGENAYKHSLAAGFTQYFTKRLSLQVRGGGDLIDSYGDKSYAKPMVSATLRDELNENTTARVTFTREYSLNPYIEDVFNSWEASVSLDSRITKKLLARVSGFYGKGEYIANDITDKLGGVNAGLSYELKKDMKLDVDYSYTKAVSNDKAREFSRNAGSCALRMDF